MYFLAEEKFPNTIQTIYKLRTSVQGITNNGMK